MEDTLRTKACRILSFEETRDKIAELLSLRCAEGETPKGDLEVLRGEFIDYKTDGTLIVKFPILQWQRNGLGNLQGGMQGCLMDCVYGVLAHVSVGCKPIATVDMTSNFIKGVRAKDEEVVVYARILNMGKRILHAVSQMYNSEGELVSTSTTNMTILQENK